MITRAVFLHCPTLGRAGVYSSTPVRFLPFGYNSTATARHEVVALAWTFAPDEWWEHIDDLPAGRRPPIFKSDDSPFERAAKEHKAIAFGITSGVVLGIIVGWLGIAVEESAAASIEADVVLSNRAAGQIIGWPVGQATAGQTAEMAANLTVKEVVAMQAQGLNLATVQALRLQYATAVATGGAKLLNEQLLPRLQLMDKIIALWPR